MVKSYCKIWGISNIDLNDYQFWRHKLQQADSEPYIKREKINRVFLKDGEEVLIGGNLVPRIQKS